MVQMRKLTTLYYHISLLRHFASSLTFRYLQTKLFICLKFPNTHYKLRVTCPLILKYETKS